MKLKPWVVALHIVGWIFFIFIPVFNVTSGKITPDDDTLFVIRNTLFRFTPFYICIISFYYINAALLMPFLFFKEKYLTYTVSIALAMLLTIFIIQSIPFNPDPNLQKFGPPKRMLTTFIVFYFVIVFLLSSGIRITQQWMKAEKSRKEIETEKLNTELSFLKAQINPHFLFNTLNNIYSLAQAKSDLAGEAIIKLSSLMRYALQETKNDMVPLDQDLSEIREYIDLQSLRLGHKNTVHVQFDVAPSEYTIAPLILLPFIENAFKYGVSNHVDSEIKIRVSRKGDTLQFTCVNPNNSDAELEKSSGIGIENSKRRLNIIYPGKHDLQIRSEGKTFEVDLRITLT